MKPQLKHGRRKWLLAGFALVFGLLVWVLIMRARTGWAAAIRVLPDGTKYRFGGATWGTNQTPPFFAERVVAHLPKALAALVQKKFGQRLGLVPISQNDAPELQVWMNQIASPPAACFRPSRYARSWWMRMVWRRERPILMSTATIRGRRRVFRLFPGAAGCWKSTSTRMTAIPAGASEIGSVRFRNPLYGKYPQWNRSLCPRPGWPAGSVDTHRLPRRRPLARQIRDQFQPGTGATP